MREYAIPATTAAILMLFATSCGDVAPELVEWAGQRRLEGLTIRMGLGWDGCDSARTGDKGGGHLARSALEDLLTVSCALEELDVSRASTRVQLACLRAVLPSIGGAAAVAWSGLSRACHQHAYEIAPHHTEVVHLVSTVRQIAATHQLRHVATPGPE